jgi:hypothetical protein
MTDRGSGFSDDNITALQRLTPFLGLAIKSASLARIAETFSRPISFATGAGGF